MRTVVRPRQVSRTALLRKALTSCLLVISFFAPSLSTCAGDVERLIEQLSDADEDRRAEACKALGALGDAQAAAALEKALRDASAVVRADAASALVQIGGTAAESIFVKLLDSNNSELRQIGVMGLAGVGTTEAAAERLMAKLSDENWRVRWSAATALGSFADARAIEPLLKLAESDSNDEVKAAAQEAVVRLKSHIRWQRDIGTAYKKAQTLKKPLLLLFTAHRSDWCRSFDNNILADPAVVDAAEKFVCVRLDVGDQKALIAKYEIRGVPTVVLTDTNGNETGRLVGYSAKELLLEKMAEATRGHSTFREWRRQALDHPEDAEANWRTAEVYLAEDRLTLAINHLKNVIENDPKNLRGYRANALFALGFAQGRLGQHAAALAVLTQYLAEHPGHKDRDRALYCLALSQIAVGKKNEARQTLESLIKEAPESTVTPAAIKVLEKLNAQ